MSDLNKEITIKLTIDDKEFSSILSTTSSKIDNLSSKFDDFSSKSNTLSGSTREAASGTGAMDNALGELGSALQDSDKFLDSFREGTLAILGHIPVLIQSFKMASVEAGVLRTTVSGSLVASLSGPAGLGVAITGISLLLQVLPGLFSKNTDEIKKQKEGVKKLRDEYKALTDEQIKGYLASTQEELTRLVKKHPKIINKEGQYGSGMAGAAYSYEVSGKERFGEDLEYYQLLLARNVALTETLKKLGDQDILQNKISLNENKKRSIQKDQYDKDTGIKKENYWKDIVPEATSYQNAIDILNKGIDEYQKLHDSIYKSKQSSKNERNTPDTDNEKFEKQKYELGITQEHATRMAEIQEKGDKELLNMKIAHFIEMISLYEKYGQNTLEIQYNLEEAIAENEKKYGKGNNKSAHYIKATDGVSYKGLEEIPFKSPDTMKPIPGVVSKEEKDKWDIENLDNVYDHKRARENLEYKLDQQKYINLEELKKSHEKKLAEIDKEEFLNKVNLTSQIVNTITGSYNLIYSEMQSSVGKELGDWEKKEKKKLDEERKAALSHAKTSKQKEKINEDYDKKEEALEEEKNKKGKERMAAWFAFQKALNIAQATIATYKAADEALGTFPPGPWNIALAAAVIAAGLANVAVIASQQMPGYAKGGAVIGEHGPEIIAPFQDYASGQAKLIAMTMMTLKDEMRQGDVRWKMENVNSNNSVLEIAINKLNKRLDEGIYSRAYLDDAQAKKMYSRGSALNRKSKI